MTTSADASQSGSLIEPALVALDVDLGVDAEAVIDGLARIVTSARGGDGRVLAQDAWWREQKSPTGMPGGFAIPHCRSAGVSAVSLGCVRLSRPVHFGAADGPADIVFLIATPLDSGTEHLRLLGRLARALVRPEFLAALRGAQTAGEVADIVRAMVEPPAEQMALGSGALTASGSAQAASGNRRAARGRRPATRAGRWTRRHHRDEP